MPINLPFNHITQNPEPSADNLTNAYIIDTTLRDGEQSPGVAFSAKDKMKIAELLHQLGVDEVEAGTPAISQDERDAIRSIASAGFCFVTSSWSRAIIADIVQAAQLGTQSINISLPVSEIQISTLVKTQGWVLTQLQKTVTFAKGIFPHVTIGAQDASRADYNFLLEFLECAKYAGADRVRIADTVGLLDSMETQQLISSIKRDFPDFELEFHGHNDFGMATANAIAALKGGADCISATVNGLGERAGNSALEEVIAYLYVKSGVSRFDTKVVNKLCECVSKLSKSAIPNQKAITGHNAFRHESGIHTSAIFKNILSYQVLNPADFGVKETEIVLGKHSGMASIKNYFKSLGSQLDEGSASQLFSELKCRIGS